MRLFSSLLIALTMLLSSVAMASGNAAAMPHGTAVKAVAVAGHCAGDETPADHEKPDRGMSCAVACAAFPALPPVGDETIDEPCEPATTLYAAAGPRQLPTIELEGETPPPRMTPRI